MKLFGFWRSTATWRVRIALNLKGIEYEYVPVHLRRDGGEQHREAFRAMNPIGHVPVLEIEIDGTVRQLGESIAIIELLEELHPRPALLPADMFLRARARQIALLVVSGIQPLQNTAVQIHLHEALGVDEQAWVRHWVDRGLNALESLTQQTAGRFAVADQVSIADVCIAPQMHFAERFGIELARYPTLARIHHECSRIPAFQAAHADRQLDAEH